MNTTNEILARIGVDPGQLGPLPDALGWLKHAGFPLTKASLYKLQMLGEAPPRFLWSGRSLYRASDVITWALQRAVRPEDGAQLRGAQTRRRNREAAQQDRVAA